MTDSQLFTLVIGIVFPICCLIYQVGVVASAINRLNESIRSSRLNQTDAELRR